MPLVVVLVGVVGGEGRAVEGLSTTMTDDALAAMWTGSIGNVLISIPVAVCGVEKRAESREQGEGRERRSGT